MGNELHLALALKNKPLLLSACVNGDGQPSDHEKFISAICRAVNFARAFEKGGACIILSCEQGLEDNALKEAASECDNFLKALEVKKETLSTSYSRISEHAIKIFILAHN